MYDSGMTRVPDRALLALAVLRIHFFARMPFATYNSNMTSPLGIAVSILLAGGLIIAAMVYANPSGSANVSEEPELAHAHGLAVDVANPNRLLIATHHGLLQLENESSLSRVGTARDDYMGFTPHPSDATTFFSSGHPVRGGNLGFQKSTDGGISWTKQPSPARRGVHPRLSLSG